jgi:hypothetical protein
MAKKKQPKTGRQKKERKRPSRATGPRPSSGLGLSDLPHLLKADPSQPPPQPPLFRIRPNPDFDVPDLNWFSTPPQTVQALLASINLFRPTAGTCCNTPAIRAYVVQLNNRLTLLYADHPTGPEPPELDPNVSNGFELETQVDRAKRWLLRITRPTEKPRSSPVREPRGPACTHSPDFSSVLWYGQTHVFTASQATAVSLLWAEWEKDPKARLGLREKTIGEKIGSENQRYRLLYTFRQKTRLHSAWGTMVHAQGNGFFFLAPPSQSCARKPPKSKRRSARKLPRS